MSIKVDFIQQLRSSFPGLSNEPLETQITDNLLSPFTVELPESVLTQAQTIISTLFSLRERKSYQQHYSETVALKGLNDPGNKSIMMSYDFHLDDQQNLKLIEVNTNASFLVLGHEMYKAHKLPLPISDFSLDEIRQNILTEMTLQGKNPEAPFKVAITDDKPSEQRLFVEFLVYNTLFKSWGWDSRIVDYRDLFKSFVPEFIYNRYTDFFLSEESSQLLRDKFLNRDVCVSPNPYEYLLLADKQRLIDWVQEGFLESHGLSEAEVATVKTATPMCYDMRSADVDQIWSQRKKLFFKPKNAFGSKQSYKGASISRKTFDELDKNDTIAQEFIPAPEVSFETPEGPQTFKYDLRCYAYQGRMQIVVARLYQGQVTNLRTPYGGFAPVIFK